MNSDIRPGTLEHWATQKPDAIALVEGETVLTYAAWNERANRVAAGLRAHGVVAGDIVVLRTQIRAEWAVIASALAKIGCSLLALNWRLTPSETRYVLSNSGANVLICDDSDPAALMAGLADFPLKLAVSIGSAVEGLVPYAALEANSASPSISAADPPLIIYTSGTTGLPKGVVMSGRAAALTDQRVAEYLQDIAAQRRKAAGTAVLITLPMHHGAGPSALWGALREGVTVVMLRRFDPEATLRLIDQHKITAWTGVPTMYKRIATLPADVLGRYDMSSLQSLSVGAAPVPPQLKLWIDDYFGKNKLAEGYGATEVGMITYTPPGAHIRKPGSSGLAHKHVDIRIRDDNGAELPTGSVGEIWVRTPTTIRQYLNGQVLGPDTLDADGFFRVGDVGHLDSDGYLFISDRAKDMIISGGVNIYPAEIEAGLLTHEAVQDAAVIGIPDDEFGEQIKAFIEVKPGWSPSVVDILAHARKHLASYKQPKSVEFIAELPRNTMGKILKRELREPYWKNRERKV
jgi:long-chain acyl-CoA synthetase